MPGDPKELRLRARQCSRLAERATKVRERQTLLRLHRSYNRLAVEVENAQARLATLKATELGDDMDAESPMPTRDSEAST
jgi:hypothetical protein